MSAEPLAIYENGTIRQWSLGDYGNKQNISGIRKTFYHYKDHLSNIRLVIDATEQIVSAQDYFTFGKTSREYVFAGGSHNYKFTSKELDQSGYLSFGYRYYNADLNRWFNPDPAHQFASPYVFNGNIPVIGVDRDGRFAFLVPILIAAAEGAAYGALISATMYSIMSGENFTWDGFGKALTKGAVSGAIGGAIGQSINMLYSGGSAGTNNIILDGLQSSLSDAAIKTINNETYSLNDFIYSFTGGAVSGIIPDYVPSSETGAFKSILSEIGRNGILKGAVSGLVQMNFRALMGEKVDERILINQILGQSVKTGLNIAVFGYSYMPDENIQTDNRAFYDRVSNGEKINNYGRYSFTYRSGGFYGMITDRGLALGRNLMVQKDSYDKNYLLKHEGAHYYQQIRDGYFYFNAKGLYEQTLYTFGVGVYNNSNYNEGEIDAENIGWLYVY